MFRQWVIAGVIVCGGEAVAQPWPAVPAAKADAETVYVMRTAGQSDRVVKVVRAADPADPMSMAEVKDTTTGQTFVIPGKVLAKLARAGTPRVETPVPVETPPATTVSPTKPSPVATAEPAVTQPPPKVQLPSGEPNVVTPVVPLPAPVALVKAETVSPAPPPVPVAPAKPTDLPTVASPVKPTTPSSPPQVNDPWRATGEVKAFAPTPLPAAAGPRLTHVPTWRAAPKPTPAGVNDPWRPSGG